MLTNIKYIALFGFFLFISCKKSNDLPYDREEQLQTDTAIYLYRQQKTFISPTEVQVNLELGQFTDLTSALSYLPGSYGDPIVYENSNIAITFSGETRVEHSPINEYTTLFVLDENAIDWYDYNHIGFNLRRFFEQIDMDSKKRAGLFFFNNNNDGLTTTFVEDQSRDVFTTGWDAKVQEYYQLKRNNEVYYGNTSAEGFYSVMNEALDKLISSPEAVGQKSITSLIVSNELYLGGDPALNLDLMNLINKANANSIQINFITDFSSNIPYYIADKTNGFIQDSFEQPLISQNQNDWDVSPKAVIVQNLNDLLSQNIATYGVTIKMEPLGGAIFTTGENHGIAVRFLSYEFFLPVVIP